MRDNLVSLLRRERVRLRSLCLRPLDINKRVPTLQLLDLCPCVAVQCPKTTVDDIPRRLNAQPAAK